MTFAGINERTAFERPWISSPPEPRGFEASGGAYVPYGDYDNDGGAAYPSWTKPWPELWTKCGVASDIEWCERGGTRSTTVRVPIANAFAPSPTCSSDYLAENAAPDPGRGFGVVWFAGRISTGRLPAMRLE